MVEKDRQHKPGIPPPPPRQPDVSLKGYIERENAGNESTDGSGARPSTR